MADSGIYEIVNTANGKRYVGSAKNFAKRWRLHRLHLRRGTHHSRHLQSSWIKHGENAFDFRIIRECDPEILICEEQREIDAQKCHYNICPTAGSTLGRKFTKETKAKMSESRRGKKLPPRTAEHCANLSQAAKDRAPNLERIAKMAATKRGSTLADEHKAKITIGLQAAWEQGKRVREKSPDWRAKIAATLTGRKATPEHRANQSAAQLGKKRGPYKKRLSVNS